MKYVFAFLLLAVAAIALGCDTRYNAGPNGENRDCPQSSPYCVQASALSVAFCSSCNPELKTAVCDCPSGGFCEKNRNSTKYGTCTQYPLFGAKCGSAPDCVTVYKDAAGNQYDSYSLQCVLGYCRPCNYILQSTPFTCTNGTLTGDTIVCSKSSNNWSIQSSSSSSSGAGEWHLLVSLILYEKNPPSPHTYVTNANPPVSLSF